jgi:hypothetical protein
MVLTSYLEEGVVDSKESRREMVEVIDEGEEGGDSFNPLEYPQ